MMEERKDLSKAAGKPRVSPWLGWNGPSKGGVGEKGGAEDGISSLRLV